MTSLDRISARDRAVLPSIEQHQFLATRHIEALHFTDIAPSARSRITRRNLARLRDLRVIAALDRKLGGARAGSEGMTYFVDVVGDRILHERPGQRARQTHEPSARFLRHRLAIADAHITLIQADRNRQVELAGSAVEPAAWRAFTGIACGSSCPQARSLRRRDRSLTTTSSTRGSSKSTSGPRAFPRSLRNAASTKPIDRPVSSRTGTALPTGRLVSHTPRSSEGRAATPGAHRCHRHRPKPAECAVPRRPARRFAVAHPNRR